MTAKQQVASSETTEADLEKMLDDLELDEAAEAVNDEVIEEMSAAEVEDEVEIVDDGVDDGSMDLDDDELRELEMDIERTEIYNAQPAGASVSVVHKVEPPAAAKTTKTTASTTSTRTPRDLTSVPAEFFVLSGDPATMTAADLDANKAAVIASKPTQKKVAEKFENLFQAIAAGKKPSNYTSMAIAAMKGKTTISSADLVGAYKAAGLGDGTARSQSGQMMVLLPIAGVATRSGSVLTIDPGSLVMKRVIDIGV